MNIENLVGKAFGFYGVDGNCFKLGNLIFEVVEDEEDDYRSMGKVKLIDGKEKIFCLESFAYVKIVSDDGGYRLIDVEDGHEWLCFGTCYYDEWYPCFRFEYVAKEM